MVDDAADAGIKNIHLDLMYGLPGQSDQEWRRTLRTAVSLPITHISTYKLYVFKDGVLHREGYHRARDETAAETSKAEVMHNSVQDVAEAAGFKQYSLTEYARAGSASEYIRNCFDGGDILPIGPGAFGRCGNEVWENSPYVHVTNSLGQMRDQRAFRLTGVEAFKRDVILGLWLLNVDLTTLAAKHGVTIRPELSQLLDELRCEDAIEYSHPEVNLARHQRFRAGQAMVRLAELPARHWATAVGRLSEMHCSDVARDGHPADNFLTKLDSIARMARRDFSLFTALANDPTSVLEKLGYDLSEPPARLLIDAIRGSDGVPNGFDRGAVRRMWAAISGEHKARISGRI